MKKPITTKNIHQFIMDDEYIDLLSEFIKKQLIKDKKFDKKLRDVEIIYCTNDDETDENIYRIKYTPYVEEEEGIWMGMKDEIIKLRVGEIIDIFNKILP